MKRTTFGVLVAAGIALALVSACGAFGGDDAKTTPAGSDAAVTDGTAPDSSVLAAVDAEVDAGDGASDGGDAGSNAPILHAFDANCVPLSLAFANGQGTLAHAPDAGKAGGACRLCLTKSAGTAKARAIADIPVPGTGQYEVKIAYLYDGQPFLFQLIGQEVNADGTERRADSSLNMANAWRSLTVKPTLQKNPNLRVVIDSDGSIDTSCVLLDDLTITRVSPPP